MTHDLDLLMENYRPTTKIEYFSIGQPKQIQDERGSWYSAIFREAVTAPISLEQRGFVGDQVADTKHHGSLNQAVCCHPALHYAAWNKEFGLDAEAGLTGGAVGENWTLTEVTEVDVCIGDIFRVGSARVQVSQPRYPCFKQERKTGLDGFLKRTGETLRTGWYMRVLEAGEVQLGESLYLTDRPHPEWTVHRVNEHVHRKQDGDKTELLLAMPELAEGWKEIIELVYKDKSAAAT